ncbi:hypothetical protein EW15_0079 [Prochlorococcus sp. MIT 0801]|nr:hypothetical protein EW15_0079 [Prochlorococcus sp. MIT 0801]
MPSYRIDFIKETIAKLDDILGVDFQYVFNRTDANISIYEHTYATTGSSYAGQMNPETDSLGYMNHEVALTSKNNDHYKNKGSNFWEHLILHELGHALHLEHPFSNNDGDVYGTTYSTTVEETAMAYGAPDEWGKYQSWFSLVDIEALKSLWGDEDSTADTTAPLITGPSGSAGASESSKTINENTTSVHRFTANETVTWSINGGNDPTFFSINSSTGELTFNNAPDYENHLDSNSNGIYSIYVKATDLSGNSSNQWIEVTIADVNEDTTAPLITGPSGSAGAENSKKTINENTTTVHTFTANETVTWSINGGNDPTFFSINSTTGLLTFKDAPDYENHLDSNSNGIYSIYVKATDLSGNSSNQWIEVTIADVNEDTTAPLITGPSGSAGASESFKTINENTTTVHTFTANEAVTWSIGGGNDPTFFSINSTTGELTFNNAPDYENHLDSNSNGIYSIYVKATDLAGNSSNQWIEVTIADVNEDTTAPLITGPSGSAGAENSKKTINENTTTVHTFTANETVTWSINGGNDPTFFSINSTTGLLTFNNAPDYENKIDSNSNGIYSIYIKATDLAGNSSNQWIEVTIADVNEDTTAPLITGPSGSAGAENSKKTINENTTTVHTFTANEAVTWSINGGNDPTFFSINSTTGLLTFNNAPDYENHLDSNSNGIYSIYVKATDLAGNSSNQWIETTIADVNEAPTDLRLISTSFNENIAASTIVSAIGSTDADTSDLRTYSLISGNGDTDNSLFTIYKGVAITYLKINSSPDYETKSSYNIRLQVTDSGGETYAKAFTLSVNDLNETPTALTLSSSSFNENIAAASTVATLSTTDDDTSDTHTYSLVTGTDDTDNSSFTIDGSSLKIKASPDYETKSSYKIRLQTTDSGGETYAEAFTLSVKDLNEAPTSWNFSSYYFDENIAADSTVAIISAVDEDQSDTHTFSLIGGYVESSGNSNFYIDGNQLKIKTSPDYEAQSTYTVVVRVTDAKGLTSPDLYNTLIVNDLEEFTATISGTSSTDIIQSTSSNDSIDGKAGTDTIVYSGSFSKYSFTRGSDTLQIADQRTTGTTDGTDTLKNIEYIQFSDQTVEESKVDVVKTYSGKFSDYKFYNKGNGVYQIKTDSGYDDITGYPSLQFTGEATTSSFHDVSAIADIKGTFDQVTGLNTDSGRMFRLYNASFKRLPDADGLKYWIDNFSSGRNTIRVVASSFLGSAEFKQRYGEDVSDSTYVNTLYKNVLGREADTSGLIYWLGQLNSGAETRYEALLGFAESAENKALFTEMTGFG